MLLLLLGCVATQDTAVVDSTCPPPHVTGVVVQVGGGPATWASVFVRGVDVDQPLQVLVDDQGRFDVQLAPGPWTLGAGTADCILEEVQIQVAECQDMDLVLQAEACEG